MLNNAGISFRINSMTFPDYGKAIENGKYDFYLAETELLPNFDIVNMLLLTNLDHIEEQLLDTANNLQRTTDITEREQLLKQLANEYIAVQPFISIFFASETFLYNNEISDFKITTLNPYDSISQMQ